ncbi:hypothetical protein [Comamonas sp. JC664]|uniref:hypothetical protein n=1 Tax=Comamonas sp. JC664 TaxID=2801917 RepID=UPI00191CEBF1|nr:hypothetical protein [Comamonas sp. JC664]
MALAWLMTRSERRGTRKELEAALRPFVEHQLSRAEWKARFESLLAALLEKGQAAPRARSALELTPAGRTQVLRFLKLEQPPRELTWRKLKATYLVAYSLGLPPTKAVLGRMKDADGVRAAALQRAHALDAEEGLTLAQTRDRLLWRQLGVETDRPFTLSAVQAHLLGKLLDTDTKAPAQALEQLAARAAGATRADAEALRLSLQRQWALSEDAEAGASEPADAPDKGTREPAATPAPAITARTTPVVTITPTVPDAVSEPAETASTSHAAEASFAEQVLTVARALPTGRFGMNKVFISHVWKALQPEWSDREAFDAALLEANRSRRLSLSRADLVSAMDPKDVAESEVRSFGARFHFVVV